MKHTTKLALALVATLALIGIGTMPVVGQVDPDCDPDFDIPDSEPITPRSLGALSSEVGQITVMGEAVEVRVELLTVGKIEFGVFIDDLGCDPAPSSKSSCDDDNFVETTDSEDPKSKDCLLQPGDTYFFHVVNDALTTRDYKIWEL